MGLEPTKIQFTANVPSPAYLSLATSLLLLPLVSNIILWNIKAVVLLVKGMSIGLSQTTIGIP